MSSPYRPRPIVEGPYLDTLPWLVARWFLTPVVGNSCPSNSSSSAVRLAEFVPVDLLERLPDDPPDNLLPFEVIGILTVLGPAAGVLRSRGLSILSATFSLLLSLCLLTALDNDDCLREVEGPLLNRTTRRGTLGDT